MIPIGRTLNVDFTVCDPNDGSAATADSVTVRVFEDANDTAILTPTATERTGHTGHYRLPIAVTAANGFEAGKSYNVVAEVDVSGVSSKAVIATFVIDTLLQDAVVADGSNSATTFKTALPSSTNDAYKDCLICFVDGSLAGQVKKCTAYNGTTKFVTFTSGFTGAPSTSDKFILINA
jgi:hypothetical protein